MSGYGGDARGSDLFGRGGKTKAFVDMALSDWYQAQEPLSEHEQSIEISANFNYYIPKYALNIGRALWFHYA